MRRLWSAFQKGRRVGKLHPAVSDKENGAPRPEPTVLALTLAEERGADEEHMLEKAGEILRGISSQLPE